MSNVFLTLTGESFSLSGNCICNTENGKPVYVSGLFPGETAVVEITDEKKDYCTGVAKELLKSSPDRRSSACPYEKECGGCNWLCLSYEAQLKTKQRFAADILSFTPDIVPSKEFGYRTRARFSYSKDSSGNPHLSFMQEMSNTAVRVASCPVLCPEINGLLACPPDLNLWELKDGQLPCVMSDRGVLAGNQTGRITVKDHVFPISNDVFFQSNLSLLPQMIDYVTDNVAGPSVMDLYSGVGTFSAFLEDKFNTVAVEINKNCLSLAKQHLKKTRFFVNAVEKYKANVSKVNTVIVDPPRTGLKDNVPSVIASWHADRIIYVSCFLASLKRDLARFKALGYTVEKARLFDFYPQTSHVETVVCLSNKNPRPKSYVEMGIDAEEYYRIKNSEK